MMNQRSKDLMAKNSYPSSEANPEGYPMRGHRYILRDFYYVIISTFFVRECEKF